MKCYKQQRINKIQRNQLAFKLVFVNQMEVEYQKKNNKTKQNRKADLWNGVI